MVCNEKCQMKRWDKEIKKGIEMKMKEEVERRRK
jgi:hypothetical protein